ncbi:MAG: tol-pal system protein YbgF [Deltaproteobacteria bacterium RBG_16_48_10]|nr:MAG: tol-pal system protein YbgF [Deltaproteobacteria bacterium RBG_16_48_10]
MRRIVWIKGVILFSVLSLLWGCATKREVVVLDRETNRLSSRVTTQQRERESLQRDMEKLQNDFKALQKETNDLKMSVPGEAKKVQADLLLRLETLQTEVRTLGTGIEEYKELLKKTPKEMDRLKENIALRTKALEDKEKILDEKDKNLEERMKGMEERLKGLEGKIGQVATKQMEIENLLRAKETSVEGKGVSARTGDLYKDAYEAYQKGDFEGARRKFEAFLKQYPNTELSDNAQFWIGETYYGKKDYEKAILEYEKAIAKYPEGDKVPAALLKQALAFLELGDKTNGRNLLKRVMERYPQSEQADMAKKRLDTIK